MSILVNTGKYDCHVADPAEKMFQMKVDKIFKELPNVCFTADDILIVCYEDDGANHDRKVCQNTTVL